MNLIPEAEGRFPREYLDAFLASPTPRETPSDLYESVLSANSYMRVHRAFRYVLLGFAPVFAIPVLFLFPRNAYTSFLMRRGHAEEGFEQFS